MTDIPADVLEAYRTTEFWVGEGDDAFCLRVDQHSPELARILVQGAFTSAAFLTAFNPASEPRSQHANERADGRLHRELTRRGVQIMEGVGKDATGQWLAERSVLALGLDLETSKEIGRHFEQNAIVWSSSDAVPALILLR